MREQRARHLALGTISFTICFAVWGLISAFAPTFRSQYHLSATQSALLVAVPVLLGSLARIPMGILTDRYGARSVFTVLFLAIAGAPFFIPVVESYEGLLAVAFWLGLAGSSFAVGVGYVSRWYPPAQQGSALGVYGLGNIGQSAAVFLGPLAAAAVGRDAIFRGMAAAVVVWAVVFFLLARNAPVAKTPPKGLGSIVGVLAKERLSWVLSLFYFLTFGGFVAFSIYLPSLLRDEFGLSATDAGARTAGFVILATLMRPIGGYVADKIGGSAVLSGVFLGVAPFALLLAWDSIVPFTVGALGCAALLGLGNGAVFKLVPELFPANTGTVTGLVGAMGGLGGFFPPLLLGVFRDRMGAVWPGFVLLALCSLGLWFLNRKVFLSRREELRLPPELGQASEKIRAGAMAVLITALLIAAIVVGSRNLQNFDAALVIYTFAIIFATFGVVYHYAIWLRKPPTHLYWERGWQIVRELGFFTSLRMLGALAGTHVAGQTFIYQRSRMRWWMHQLLMWGCLTAVAITFPLVFGWIHFGSSPDDQMTYVTYLFGFPVGSFPIRTVVSWVLFHGLDFSAVLVLAGIALALLRRLRDRGAMSVQSFSGDLMPLLLLFAISVTGLALTASSMWLRGSFYGFLAIVHAITVIGTLLYLPFGKLFHIFQRPAQLGVKLYQHAGESDPGTDCRRCGKRFASKMHIDDLKKVLPQLGFDYRLPVVGANGSVSLERRVTPQAARAEHWVELCPGCKRASLGAAQLRAKQKSMGEVEVNG